MNIEAMKIVRDNLKMGSVLSFAEVMIIQQAIEAAMQGKADGTLTNEGTIPGGNSPVIPDGWVACSERMPDVGDIVLTAKDGFVNVGEMERSGANYRFFTSIASGRELPATHWQPLPAAPQQEAE